jgi:hypothetical protein
MTLNTQVRVFHQTQVRHQTQHADSATLANDRQGLDHLPLSKLCHAAAVPPQPTGQVPQHHCDGMRH